MFNRRMLIAAVAAAAVLSGAPVSAQDKSIVVSSTTSTQDSGLFGHILPLFKQKTGIEVKVIAEGTGQALDTGRRGDADVVFVHAKSAEEKFLAEGQGVKRHPVMYNDFVLIGPKNDPRRGQGHEGRRQGTTDDQGQTGAVYIARRPVGYPSGRTRALEQKTPASISRRKKDPGTNRSAKAWVQRSTQRAPAMPTCFRIAAHGFPSRTRRPCYHRGRR